jgi:hypothetical protein
MTDVLTRAGRRLTVWLALAVVGSFSRRGLGVDNASVGKARATDGWLVLRARDGGRAWRRFALERAAEGITKAGLSVARLRQLY